ncbi:MAG: glycosyltransferase, partial [Candidatus Sericytochromatia bacterium]|nr:glycosyltransferase [Candidatus Sericytochromatia bacterium]
RRDSAGAREPPARGLARHPRAVPPWLPAATVWMGQAHWRAAEACVGVAKRLDPEHLQVRLAGEQVMMAPPGDTPIPDDWQALIAADVPQPTLAVCLIVRDEATQIDACLQSVQGADEIIVLDTGSVDDTAKVASRWGAQIHYAAWTEDFAAARNEALAHVTADWVLIIDADERLEGDLATVRRSIDDHGGDQTVLCPLVFNHGQDAQSGTRFRVGRCFANLPNHRFKGRIHERVVSTDGEAIIEWAVDTWRFRHEGYSGTPAHRQAKAERNMALLRRWLQEEPTDPDAHYYAGLELATIGDLNRASAELHAAFEAFTDDASRGLAMLHQLMILEMGGRHNDIVALGEAYQGLCRHLPDYWLALGVAYESIGRKDQAKHCFHEAAQLPADGAAVFETDGARTWKPHLYLAQLAANVGDHTTVMAEVQPLMATYGDHPRLACLYFYGLIAQDRVAEAEAFMVTALSHPATPDAMAEGMVRVLEPLGERASSLFDRLYQLPGAYQAVVRRLMATADWQELVRYSEASVPVIGAEAWLHQAYAWAELQQPAEAEVAYGRAISANPELGLAWHNLGVLSARREDWQTARLAFEGALNVTPRSFPAMIELIEVLAKLGDTDAALPIFQEANQLLPEHPEVIRLAEVLGVR